MYHTTILLRGVNAVALCPTLGHMSELFSLRQGGILPTRKEERDTDSGPYQRRHPLNTYFSIDSDILSSSRRCEKEPCYNPVPPKRERPPTIPSVGGETGSAVEDGRLPVVVVMSSLVRPSRSSNAGLPPGGSPPFLNTSYMTTTTPIVNYLGSPC